MAGDLPRCSGPYSMPCPSGSSRLGVALQQTTPRSNQWPPVGPRPGSVPMYAGGTHVHVAEGHPRGGLHAYGQLVAAARLPVPGPCGETDPVQSELSKALHIRYRHKFCRDMCPPPDMHALTRAMWPQALAGVSCKGEKDKQVPLQATSTMTARQQMQLQPQPGARRLSVVIMTSNLQPRMQTAH